MRLLILLSLFVFPLSVSAQEPIVPLTAVIGLSVEKVELGRQLFKDKRLSRDNSVSCETCHDLKTNGSDSLPRSVGVDDKKGATRSPTVYNTSYNIAQFWDGRSRTLENQVSGPVHDPVEMGSHWGQVVNKLSQDKTLQKRFDNLYPDGITATNIVDLIATFERSLVTLNSPFDKWLQGDESALTEDEKEGYSLFKAYGCISCHQGKNVGGNMYAYMGTMGDYFADRGQPVTKADFGRYNVTGNEADKHLFKVPSLRLAALQKYFFHDASVSSLDEAIQVMARYQLGRQLNHSDVGKISKFLHTLVGQHPELSQE